MKVSTQRLLRICYLSLPLALAVDNTLYYSAPTSESYTWSKSFPQSCECAESGVTTSSCELFRCKCLCDVTAGVCDYDCCCDPDCTLEQTSRFNALGSCAYEGGTIDTQYCYSTNDLYAVNPRSPMKGTSSAEEGLNRALCIEKTNYAMREDFYTNDDMQSSNIFQQSAGQKSYSYTAISDVQITTPTTDTDYDRNDTISAFMNSTLLNSIVSNGPGYFQIPSMDFDGYCNDNNYADFENHIDFTDVGSTCVRSFSTVSTQFQAQCLYQQSINRYVKDLWIARTPNVLVSSGAWTVSQLVNVKLNSVTFEDILTKTQSKVTSSWTSQTCSTSITSGGTLSSLQQNNCSFSSSSTKQALFSNSSSLCIGAVKSIFYTVQHEATAAGTITAILADVVVTDVPLTFRDEATQLHQSFGIKYVSVNSEGKSSDNGNLVTRARSGNPGYILGKPVLYGFANSTKTIDELISGLTAPISTASNVCPTSTSTIVKNPTAFGYDSVTGCTMHLTRQQLIDFCCTGAPGTCLDNSVYSVKEQSPYTGSTGRPYFLNFTQGYVGIYGDADPLDITQWFQISYSQPSDTRQWVDKTATCNNIFSGLNIKFLVSYSGERSNPQNKIVSALAEVITSDWAFRAPPPDNTTTQAFQLSVVVSYIFQNEESLRGYEPPAPPALFKVPYDVFYPFVVNGASISSGFAWSSNLLLISAMIFYFMIQI